jgi:TPR repeat protein
MERHRKQLASTLVLASAMIAAVAIFLLPPSLQAQTQAQPKGFDPALLARANAGDAKSQLLVASSYESGKGVAQDFVKAFFWFHNAAESGDPTAQFILAWKYYDGSFVSKDYLQSAAWFRKASEHADLIDMSVVMDTPSAAADLLLGKGGEYFLIGGLFEEGKDLPQDYSQAAFWYRKGAELGSASAQSALGSLYSEGKGIPQDYSQAAFWYRKAAEQGNAYSQFHLGVFYVDGKGVPKDYEQAVMWTRKAAEQGIDEAQANLGTFYLVGRGVPQDYKEAAEWLKKAADNGSDTAWYNLGTMYAKGQGVPQDNGAAYLCMDVAAARLTGPDQVAAEKARDLIATLMTPELLSKAQELASKWFAAHPPKP